VFNSELPEGHKKAYRYLEGILAMLGIGVGSLIWATAQQSKQVDDNARAYVEMKNDIRSITKDISQIQTTLATISFNLMTQARDIENSQQSVRRLEKIIIRERD
jgi:uncharacterized protein HemX